jgi:hypothetical protein
MRRDPNATPGRKEHPMDAQAALALLRARNRYVRELPSGLWARIALPGTAELIASGEVPMPVLREMAKRARKEAAKKAASNGDAPDTPDTPDPEPEAEPDIEQNIALITEMNRYRQAIVQRSLRGLASTEAELGDEDVRYPVEVIEELPEADFDLIFLWGDRQQQIDPLAATPASTT